MPIPAEFLDELKARVDLVAVVSRHVALTRRGREHLGLCPFHQEKTPSLTVNEQKGFYHCFGCGAHGTAIDFIMQYERMGFRDAVAALAAGVGLPMPVEERRDPVRDDRRESLYDANEAAAAHFQAGLKGAQGREALAYLQRRGLDDALIARFRLGFALEGAGLRPVLHRAGFADDVLAAAGLVVRPDEPARQPYDRFRGRVMFPIEDGRGRIVGFGGRALGDVQPKYLNTAETEIFHKGSLLYGLTQAAEPARKRASLVVVEGYMDVIGLARAGIDNAVAPLGTALTEEQLRLLWRHVPEPVLCFDPDRAGRRAAMRAADRALPLLRAGIGLRFAFLATDTGDDPDGVARRYPRQFLERTIADAVPLSEVLFWMETGGTAAVAAEDRAAVEARLRKRLERVVDGDLRAHFMRTFRDRLWQRAVSRRGKAGKRWTREEGPPAVAVARQRVRPQPAVLAAERTLLAALLNRPRAFSHLEEDLGSVVFSTPDLERLRQRLIVALCADAPHDADELVAALRAEGLGELLADLLGDPVIARHRALRPDAPAEDIEALWQENIAVVRAANERAGEAVDGGRTWDEDDEAMAMRRLLKLAELGEADRDKRD
ncbi:MAG: DNA primase [Rhodospirillales bacterium]